MFILTDNNLHETHVYLNERQTTSPHAFKGINNNCRVIEKKPECYFISFTPYNIIQFFISNAKRAEKIFKFPVANFFNERGNMIHQ